MCRKALVCSEERLEHDTSRQKGTFFLQVPAYARERVIQLLSASGNPSGDPFYHIAMHRHADHALSLRALQHAEAILCSCTMPCIGFCVMLCTKLIFKYHCHCRSRTQYSAMQTMLLTYG